MCNPIERAIIQMGLLEPNNRGPRSALIPFVKPRDFQSGPYLPTDSLEHLGIQ